MNTILLRNLRTTASIGLDAWSRPSKPQPLVLSLFLGLDNQNADVSDDVRDTFSYGGMCKDVLADVENSDSSSINALVEKVAQVAEMWPGESLRVEALAPKALLRCVGGLETTLLLARSGPDAFMDDGEPWAVKSQSWVIKGLTVACIIGVNAHEREEKQTVVIDLKVTQEVKPEDEDENVRNVLWQRVVKDACAIVEPTSFQTLEALASLIAMTCLRRNPELPNITVGVEKPSALAAVEGAGVEIRRDRRWLEQQQQPNR